MHNIKMNNASKIADIIFPDNDINIEKYELLYPPRKLQEGAFVTRFAPSLTGMLYLGGVYATLISKKIASQTNGIFIIRVEDTDKTKVRNDGVNELVTTLAEFGLLPDEAPQLDGTEKGEYGPYLQSERSKIYGDYIKYLLAKGRAYVCFYTQDELELLKSAQEFMHDSVEKGCYGVYAKYRDCSYEEILYRLEQKETYVIRLRNDFDLCDGAKEEYYDVIRGTTDAKDTIEDLILLKSNGIPTYDLAHVVDDHLMRVTHALRSLNDKYRTILHLKLCKAFGFSPPLYGHFPSLNKKTEDSLEQLNQVLGTDATISHYEAEGYTKRIILIYLFSIANSDYSRVLETEPNFNFMDFNLPFNKFNSVFDKRKLEIISRDYISSITANQLFTELLEWNKKYNPEFYIKLQDNAELTLRILEASKNGAQLMRKDYANMKDVKEKISYFFDECFNSLSYPVGYPNKEYDNTTLRGVTDSFLKKLDLTDTTEVWFDKMKQIATESQFSIDKRAYKANPELYKGDIGDFINIIRVALTKQTKTFDLYDILQTLKKEKIEKRVRQFKNYLNLKLV